MLLILLRALLAAGAIYLEFSLPVNETVFVPHFLALLLAATFVPFYTHWRRWFLIMSATVLFSIFNLLNTVENFSEILQQSKSVIYFYYMVGLSLFFVFSPLARGRYMHRVGLFFFVCGTGLLLFGLLENSTPLGRISDAFRDRVYVNFVYENDLRDLAMTGAVRPKAFDQEPSYAARGLAELFLLAGVMLQGRWLRVMALAGICATAAIFGSPIPLAFAGCLFIGGFTPRWLQQKNKYYLYLLLAGLAGLGLLWGLVENVPALHERYELIVGAQDESAYLRTTFMAELAVKALNENVLSGVGLGGQEKLATYFTGVSQKGLTLNTLINNALFSIPFFTGVTGCLFIGGLFWLAIRRLSPPHLVLTALFALSVMFCTGSINSSSVWISTSILIALLREKQENEVVEAAEADRPGGDMTDVSTSDII